MKKKLVKPCFKKVCEINIVFAFDEGYVDTGYCGLDF